ncbi:MAG: hypothetical protein GX456_03930 [Verrucomicrobia bacterium]|nr:hypothetical protein [Verrucomicrobiota bacterium]
MLVSEPPKGGTRTAADAVGVGRREALGVRQLAAALFFCPNNVSVPIPRHLQTPSACSAFFVVETNQNHRFLLPKSAPLALWCTIATTTW